MIALATALWGKLVQVAAETPLLIRHIRMLRGLIFRPTTLRRSPAALLKLTIRMNLGPFVVTLVILVLNDGVVGLHRTPDATALLVVLKLVMKVPRRFLLQGLP